jgi:large subunit ribosomal protein L4
MCLSDKVSSGHLVLLDRLELAAPKTKQIAALLAKLPVSGKILLAVSSLGETAVVRASRNLPAVEVIGAANLNALAILGHETLMLPLLALEIVEATFKPKK